MDSSHFTGQRISSSPRPTSLLTYWHKWREQSSSLYLVEESQGRHLCDPALKTTHHDWKNGPTVGHMPHVRVEAAASPHSQPHQDPWRREKPQWKKRRTGEYVWHIAALTIIVYLQIFGRISSFLKYLHSPPDLSVSVPHCWWMVALLQYMLLRGILKTHSS